MTRQEQAERFARALQSTSDRYYRGCLSKATWKSHMASLWGQVRAAGLYDNVLELVDPALVGLRPTGEQRI